MLLPPSALAHKAQAENENVSCIRLP